MNRWRWSPYFDVFTQCGIDPATLTPLPLQGPPSPPEQGPPSPPERISDWQLQKAATRLQRQVDKAQSGRWMVRAAFALSGKDVQAVEHAQQLIADAAQLTGQPG